MTACTHAFSQAFTSKHYNSKSHTQNSLKHEEACAELTTLKQRDTFTHILSYPRTHTRRHARTRMHPHRPRTHTHTHANTRTHIHTRTHTRTQTHAHTENSLQHEEALGHGAPIRSPHAQDLTVGGNMGTTMRELGGNLAET